MPLTFGHLLPPLGPTVHAWLAEDIPSFDYGGAVVGESERIAYIWGKSNVTTFSV